MRTLVRAVAGPVLTVLLLVPAAPASAADSYDFTHAGNPILADGSYYSADPAPLVADGELYLYTGHDEAGPAVNDFQMNEWGAFRTNDVGSGEWTHFPSLIRPETVFAWASPGRAYAGQVVQGPDGRYYWYVPVSERASTAPDRFAIGVAVSDTPTGPWTDHVGGPLISQRVPTANTIQNIDPTVAFDPVSTSRLRATIAADGNGDTYSAVAVTEWRVFADDPGADPADVPVTVPGADAYQSFPVRAASVPAGSIQVRATGALGGESATTTPYGALTCGAG